MSPPKSPKSPPTTSQPESQPESQPDPASSAEPVDLEPGAEPDTEVPPADPTDEMEVPLSRADRRAKATNAEPSHVGPRGGRSRQGRGARSHTKRRIS